MNRRNTLGVIYVSRNPISITSAVCFPSSDPAISTHKPLFFFWNLSFEGVSRRVLARIAGWTVKL